MLEEEMGMATFLGGTRFIFWADFWLLRKSRKTGHRADVDGLSRRDGKGNFIIKPELEIRTSWGARRWDQMASGPRGTWTGTGRRGRG